MDEKPMTFAEWFAWMEDIFKTNPHAHDWAMVSKCPDGGISPAFESGTKRVFI